MPEPTLRRARVRVPCSTSNLGAGFDCIGLALSRYLTAEFVPGGSSLTVERSGTLQSLDDSSDIIPTIFRDQLARRGLSQIRGTLSVASEIPVGRGLGSSAAATVAALLLAHAVSAPNEPDPQQCLEDAAEREGHPDNAAPALLGGLVAVARSADGAARAVRLPLSDTVGFAFAAPNIEVPTQLARRALPRSVPHEVAVRGLGRIAALLQGFANGDPELLRIGFTDELHVPYRLPLIPHAEAAMHAAMDAGAWAVTISGSGSGLIAVAPRGSASRVASTMAAALQEGTGFVLEADRQGGTIEVAA